MISLSLPFAAGVASRASAAAPSACSLSAIAPAPVLEK
jgi:hypothetical protein